MIWRALSVAVGLASGFGAAQLPEFSQQYVQRLGGAVDTLDKVVADFDSSAKAAGLTRQEALAELQGTDFLDRRQKDMQRTFARQERLTAQLAALSGAPASKRVLSVLRASDPELVRATVSAFRPAMPASASGLLFGGSGFLTGLLAVSGLGALLRRRRTA